MVLAAGPSPESSATAPEPAPSSTTADPAWVVEFDERDPAVPKWRLNDRLLQIGDRQWAYERNRDGEWAWYALDPPVPVPQLGRPLLAFVWTPQDRDTARVVGAETADGSSAIHYQFVAVKGDHGESLPPDTGRDDGRGRLDLWVAEDGTILRAKTRHDREHYDATSLDHGADVTITAPESDAGTVDPYSTTVPGAVRGGAG